MVLQKTLRHYIKILKWWLYVTYKRFFFCLNKNRSTMKCMAIDTGLQSCCRKLPVQLWEEVIKTTRTDWRAERWWWKSNKNDMTNLLQSGAHAVWVCLCPCVCPGGQGSLAGVWDDSHLPPDVAAVESEGGPQQKQQSAQSAPEWQNTSWSISLWCVVSCVNVYDVYHKTTSPDPQHLCSRFLTFHYLPCAQPVIAHICMSSCRKNEVVQLAFLWPQGYLHLKKKKKTPKTLLSSTFDFIFISVFELFPDNVI